MVTREAIQATCDDIVREFTPLQVILFGSYAYGTPTEDSDVDLLVVMDIPKSEFRNKAIEIQQRIPHRFGLDLLVPSMQSTLVILASQRLLRTHNTPCVSVRQCVRLFKPH